MITICCCILQAQRIQELKKSRALKSPTLPPPPPPPVDQKQTATPSESARTLDNDPSECEALLRSSATSKIKVSNFFTNTTITHMLNSLI